MPVLPKPESTETPSSKTDVPVRTEISSSIATSSVRSCMMKAFVIPSGLIPPSSAAYIPKLIQGYSLRTE